MPRGSKPLPIPVGERFGRLVVLGRAGSGRPTKFLCLCDCGVYSTPTRANVLNGCAKSCGCARTTHGLTCGKRIPDGWGTWNSMMYRCYNPRYHGFHNYGGRGVKVCDRWHDRDTFLSDMGPRPSKKHSIDRIDPDGNYEPGNCRWVLPHIQQRNKRNSVLNEDRAEMIREMSRLGFSRSTIAWTFGVHNATVSNVINGKTWVPIE